MRRPGASLPAQCETWSDLKAAYRLLSHEAIEPSSIGGPHRALTHQSCADHSLVLAVQDATHLAGRCDRLQHTTLAVTPSGRLLGMLDQRFFARVEPPAGETRLEREGRWRESCVWSDAARAVGAGPPGCRFVHVADRAGDDLNFMEACEASGSGFVIRARHDRRINEGQSRLWRHLSEPRACGTIAVRIGAQRDGRGKITRRDRSAEVSIRFAAVQLEPPWNHPGEHAPRRVWVVYLREDDPPAPDEAVDWMLLTSEVVETEEEARRIVTFYQRRWVIEEWHRALKEGCRVEDSQLDEAEDHLRLAALLSVIAVRLVQLRDLADPQHDEARSVEVLHRWAPPLWIAVVARLGRHDAATMTPQQFMLTIARRGGYLARRRDPRPGWKVLWRGWSEVALLVEGAQLALNEKPLPT